MSIRPATTSDIPLIRQRLSELVSPPYLGATVEEQSEHLQVILDNEVVFIDEEHGAISDWHRHDGLGMIKGRYVLPADMGLAVIFPLLRDTWAECLARWPECAGWRLEGNFEQDNDAKCRIFRIALTRDGDGPHVEPREDSGQTVIWWTLERALDRVNRVIIDVP